LRLDSRIGGGKVVPVAKAADVNIVSFDAADHVNIEHGDRVVERQSGILDQIGGSRAG